MSEIKNINDDFVLWQKLKAGDPHAVKMLMKKYYNDLYTYGAKLSLNRSLTKDCIQDLFFKLWKERETLNDVTYVKTYLLKSLKRKIIKEIIKENKLTYYEDLLEERLEIVFSPQDILITQEEFLDQKESILKILNKLPKRHREAIFLRFYQELDNVQIAEIMSLHPQSVYNLIHEALKSLKVRLLACISLILLILSCEL